MKAFLVAAFILLVSTGCISHRSGVNAGVRPGWEKGVTTRRDVVEKWGNPDSVKDGVWVWKEGRLLGGRFKAGYMGVGFRMGRTRLSSREWRLTFDEKGVLAGEEVRESVPGGVKWTVWPF